MAYGESHLQQTCVAWFRCVYPELAHVLIKVPNEAKRPPKLLMTRSGPRYVNVAVNRLKAEGMVAGVADLLLLHPKGGFGSLAIEMKYAKGRQSPEQRKWQEEFERSGNKYVVCRTADEFISAVSEYLADESKVLF